MPSAIRLVAENYTIKKGLDNIFIKTFFIAKPIDEY